MRTDPYKQVYEVRYERNGKQHTMVTDATTACSASEKFRHFNPDAIVISVRALCERSRS